MTGFLKNNSKGWMGFFAALILLCIVSLSGCASISTDDRAFAISNSDAAASIAAADLAQGDRSGALQEFMEALRIDRDVDNRGGELRDLSGLGRVLVDTGDYGMARGYLEEAVKLAGELKDHKTLSDVYFTLARVEYFSGRVDLAASYIARSLQFDDGHEDGEKLDLKANIYIRYARLDEALAVAGESLKANRVRDLWPETANSLRTIAVIKSLQKRPVEAIKYYSDAYAIDMESGDQRNIALDLEKIAEIHYKEGNRLLSARLLEKSYIASLNGKDPTRAVRSLERIINIYKGMGDVQKVRLFTGIKEGLASNMDGAR